MITKDQVYGKLKTVMDPELHINIVDLGLIYDVIINKQLSKTEQLDQIRIIMTLTTPGCPLAPEIDRLVREAIRPLGNYDIEVELVWEPAWNKEKMSEEAKLTLGMI